MDVQVGLLREALQQTQRQLGELYLRHESAVKDRLTAVKQLEASIEQLGTDLRVEAAAAKLRAVEVDARALPVVGIGILLGGLSEVLTDWPFVGAVVLAGSAAFVAHTLSAMLGGRWAAPAAGHTA